MDVTSSVPQENLSNLQFQALFIGSRRSYVFTCHPTPLIKEALDNFSLIPIFFFKKSWDFYTFRRIYLCNKCMCILTCNPQFSYKDMRIFLSSAILKSRLQKILIQWSMGHSGDDVNHKKPQKMKTHWPNQLKISVLVFLKFSIELGTKI